MRTFVERHGQWRAGGALDVDVKEQSDTAYVFDVTRCRYAEMYRALGMEELGAALSCNRDGTMVQGFNRDIEFTRNQTIMNGASHCDFSYRLRAE